MTLVHRYKLDETSGTTVYDTGSNPVNGVNTNCTMGHTGKLGTCYFWQGDTLYGNVFITINPLAEITNNSDYTIAFWLKKNNVIATSYAFQHVTNATDRCVLSFSDNIIRLGHHNGTSYFQKSGIIEANKWYHVVMIHNGSTKANTFYLNNVVQTGTTAPFASNTVGFRIGSSTAGTSNIIGYIDDFRVYNNMLSESDVTSLFNMGKLYLNVNDNFLNLASAKINISDSWKSVSHAKINIGDAWKTVF